MDLQILRTVPSMRQFRSTLPGPVSLIPTMGMLHSGHMSLVKLAAHQTSSIIVSIYANPAQLRTSEDHTAYPSTLEEDVALLQDLGQELLNEGLGRLCGIFVPTNEAMYPYPQYTDIANGVGCFVTIAPLAALLEGADQPTHFIGVATVCLKLFNVVQPHKAYFGEKDYQQALLIRRLVDDLLLDIDVVVGDTIREEDGLPISSRNVYLGKRRRRVAVVLHRALSAAEDLYRKGTSTKQDLISASVSVAEEEQRLQENMKICDRVRFEVVYFQIFHHETMKELEKVDPVIGAVLSGAIRMMPLESIAVGEPLGWREDTDVIRLIDNVRLGPIGHQY